MSTVSMRAVAAAAVLGLAHGNVVCPATFNPGIVLCQNNYLTVACRSDYLCLNVGIDQWETNGIALLHLGVNTAPPPPPAPQSIRYIYSDDQSDVVQVGVDAVTATERWESAEPLIIEIEDIIPQTGVAVLFDIYNRTLWFFGPVPEEVEAHVRSLGCVSRGTAFKWKDYAIDTNPSSATGCFRGGRLCATPQLDHADRHRLGFYVNSTTMCFYEPDNDEIDHLSEAVALGLLMLYLCLWIGWTEPTWAIATTDADDKEVWKNLYKFLPVNVDAMTFVFSLQLVGAVRQSHALYSFESIRIIGKDNLIRIIDFFSYGFSSVVVAGILIVHLHVLAFHPQPIVVKDGQAVKEVLDKLWFTWGTPKIESLGDSPRRVIFVGALLVGTGLSFFFWFFVAENITAAILCTIYVAVVVICWANFPRLGAKLRKFYNGGDNQPALPANVRRIHLLWLRTATEQLVFQCIIQSIPFDVVGTLALEYHNGIVLAVGLTQLVVCGRDYALLVWRLLELGRRGLFFIVLLTGYAMGVITFSIVFTVVSLFGTAQGTRNRDGSALLLSITLAIFIFSSAIAITAQRVKCLQAK
jgi:hypothetical protein